MDELRRTLAAEAQAQGLDLAALARQTGPVLEQRRQVDAVAWKLARNERLFHTPSVIPRMYANAQPGDARVREWINLNVQDPRNYPQALLVGAKGTGKTTNGIGALKALVTAAAEHPGPSVTWKYVSHANAAREMRDFRSDHAREYFDRLLQKDILFFDDIGTVVGREWGQEWLGLLVDVRYGNEMTTIYSANESPEALAKKGLLDDRIASRLIGGRVIVMNGDDLRRQRTEIR